MLIYNRYTIKIKLFVLIQIFIILLPNFALLVYSAGSKTIPSFLKDGIYIFIAFALLILPLTIPKINQKYYFIALTPFSFLSPFAFSMIYLLGKNPASDIFVLIFNSNMQEFIEFFGTTTIFKYCIYMCFSGFIYLWFVIKTESTISFKKTRLPIFASIFVLLGCIGFRDVYIVGYSLNEAINRYSSHISKTYPFGTFLNFIDGIVIKKEIDSRNQNLKSFKFSAKSKVAAPLSETYVLVIGETSRYKNWSINGYSRNTNPLLSKVSGLVSYSDVASSAVITQDAIPFILTRCTPIEQDKCINEKSVLSAFKEAEFKTYWLSNQEFNGTSLQSYVFESDEYVYTLGNYNVDQKYDEVVLGKLDQLLKDTSSKKFIVIHTLGSHYIYSYRYPKKFDFFQPSLKGFSIGKFGDIALKTPMINSYDNSILYTDYILSEIIRKIQETGSISTVMFVSDHGENLWDDDRNYFGHGLGEPTKYVSHIPLVLWLSPEYQKFNPNKTFNAFENINQSISTDNIFHTLLDLASVKYASEQLEKSFVSDSFRTEARIVKDSQERGLVDYENIE